MNVNDVFFILFLHFFNNLLLWSNGTNNDFLSWVETCTWCLTSCFCRGDFMEGKTLGNWRKLRVCMKNRLSFSWTLQNVVTFNFKPDKYNFNHWRHFEVFMIWLEIFKKRWRRAYTSKNAFPGKFSIRFMKWSKTTTCVFKMKNNFTHAWESFCLGSKTPMAKSITAQNLFLSSVIGSRHVNTKMFLTKFRFPRNLEL